MKPDKIKFFPALFIFIAILVAVAAYSYHQERLKHEQQVSDTLLRSVKAASLLVGDTYHEEVLRHYPDPSENAATSAMLKRLAQDEGVTSLYTLVLDTQNNLRFTSKDSSGEGMETTPFLKIAPPDPKQTLALRTNQIVSEIKRGREGEESYRILYYPHTTPSGYRYLIGAEIGSSSLTPDNERFAFDVIAPFLLILLGASPLIWFYIRSVREETEQPAPKTNEPGLRPKEKPAETAQNFEDPLTGLPNRHKLLFDMHRHSYWALLIVNLHNFREINDFFGVEAGDKVLWQVGQWLQSIDLDPYRLGGDEFALLVKEQLSRKELQERCEHLIRRLNLHSFGINDETVSLSVTVGIDTSPNLSLPHADIALHQAKESGKHIAFYDRENGIEEEFKSNIALSSAIHRALDSGRIICYYQPIVSTLSGKIEKYETLVRMIDEHANIIAPADFLRTAQKTRLYPQITRTVVQKACETFAGRSEEFSINLSIRDILDPDTIRYIEEMIVQTDTARRVVFEILESEGIENFESVSAFIEKMKMLGVKIAIDDFGTGYSSFETIVKLDIDYLKIDGSLIRHIHNDPKFSALVESIADLAAKMGASTIAEYVDSEDIFNRLKEMGIAYAQGYYIGRPAALLL